MCSGNQSFNENVNIRTIEIKKQIVSGNVPKKKESCLRRSLIGFSITVAIFIICVVFCNLKIVFTLSVIGAVASAFFVLAYAGEMVREIHNIRVENAAWDIINKTSKIVNVNLKSTTMSKGRKAVSWKLTGKRALVFSVCVLLIVTVVLGISLGSVSRSYKDLQSDYSASKQTINQLEIARKRLDNEVQKLTSYNESLVNENIKLGKTNDTLRTRIESLRNSSEPSQEYYSQDDPVVVYITDTGTKYHRDGCQYLRRSKIPIYIQDAIDKGYTACSKCW